MDSALTIIGAGVVGLAVAAGLSATYSPVFVIERHKDFGRETSSRNSEVIHSGLYYPRNSLKAKLCFRGNRMLYDFCRQHDILHRRCGKLIVANGAYELAQLQKLRQKAVENGVENIKCWDKARIETKMPMIRAEHALFSPSTGIVDSHGLMKQLEKQARLQGTEFVYNATVRQIKAIKNGYEIELLDADGAIFTFTSQRVINAAGLEADKIAAMLGVNDPAYKIHFCKGVYYHVKLRHQHKLDCLVYPVPAENLEGLGIHATIDLNGRMRLGPNTYYLDKNIQDYSVDNEIFKMRFYEAGKRYLPFLEPDDLSPDMAGIRPKIQAVGEPVKDFIIKNETERGFPDFVNLIGIESPGLTSALAIAEYIDKQLFK